MRNFKICNHQTKFVLSNQGNEMGGVCGTYGGERKIHTRVWWGNLKDKDRLEDVIVEGTIILKKICEKQDGRAWSGLIWLRRGASGAMLQARQ